MDEVLVILDDVRVVEGGEDLDLGHGRLAISLRHALHGNLLRKTSGKVGKTIPKMDLCPFPRFGKQRKRNGGGMQIFVSKITLMMTSRLSLCLRQRYTVPKAPRPTTRIRSYLSILKMSPLLVGFYRKQRISLSHFWFFCLLLWQMFSSKVTLVCSRFQASFFFI